MSLESAAVGSFSKAATLFALEKWTMWFLQIATTPAATGLPSIGSVVFFASFASGQLALAS